MPDKVTCYFSFRSPYSWLALYRLAKIIDKLEVSFEFIPIFPPRGRKTSMEEDDRKIAYLRQDIRRFAEAYGLGVTMPEPFDINWLIPHSAFLYADDAGAGLEFCNRLFAARFSGGEDISSAEIIKKAADSCGLDADAVVAAGRDRKYHHRILSGLSALSDTNVFGVPIFFYGDQQYWGNDRLEWLIHAIYRDRNQPLPDLVRDPLQRPF